MSTDAKMTTGESLVAMVMSFLLAFLGGYVLSVLWGWFIVPLGVRAIGTFAAWGLALTIGMVTSEIKSDSRSFSEFLSSWSYSLSYHLMSLLVGWLIHLAAS